MLQASLLGLSHVNGARINLACPADRRMDLVDGVALVVGSNRGGVKPDIDWLVRVHCTMVGIAVALVLATVNARLIATVHDVGGRRVKMVALVEVDKGCSEAHVVRVMRIATLLARSYIGLTVSALSQCCRSLYSIPGCHSGVSLML